MKMIHKDGCGGEVKGFAKEAKRPGKKVGKVANDVFESAPRSATMPRPTTDTKYTKGKRP